jgi:ribonuclease G
VYIKNADVKGGAMKKEIIINESMGETRIAILEEDRLVEVYVEKQGQQRMVSNIYKGKVENVIPGMQAAFVDIGYGINAFLPFSEIHNGEFLLADVDREDTKRNNKKRVDNGNIAVDLHTGQEIFVQIIKEPFANKGPRVTTEIAIPGRLLVLVPNVNYIGISKKLWDKYERRRLKKIANNLRNKDFGLIIRTVAEGKSEEQITNDYEMLIKCWQKLGKKAKNTPAPVLIYEDLETASSVIRDLLTTDVGKITVDSKKLYNKLHKYLEDVSPNLSERLQLYKIKSPLFESMGIEDEIARLMSPIVRLKSGAYLVIEKTEAMVVVDVNSGRFIGKQLHELNSLKINLEAAREIARQLRLRDLSGLIVIDFIDMREQENQRKVYNELRNELKKDRAKVAVSPISEFGLLEMTRQRIRQSLLDSMTEECPTCHGAGQIISKETLLTRIDHWLRRYKAKHRNLRLKLLLHPEIEEHLRLNKKRALRGLMWRNFVHIKIEANPEIHRDQFEFITVSDGKNVTNELEKDNSKT